MKIAKLSLATIVAVGAMTTFASATPLEEAIKGVELNGYVRYRYYNDDSDAKQLANKEERHRFTSVLDFTMPVAENLKSGVMVTVDGSDYAADNAASDKSSGLSYNLDRVWFQYAVNGFSLKGGKIEILSPWTDPGYRGAVGDGALALYTGVPGWVFGAGAFVDTNVDPYFNGKLGRPAASKLADDKVAGIADELGITVTQLAAAVAGGNTPLSGDLSKAFDIGQENLYAAAVIGAVGPVSLQGWAASMEHVIDYTFYGNAEFKMAGFSFQAQMNYLQLADETQVFLEEAGFYYGLLAGYEGFGFNADLGYTKNDEDQPLYTLSNDDSSGFIFFGQQLAAETVNTADAQVIFADVGYGIGKFDVGAGYGFATAYKNVQVTGSDDLGQEWYISGGYKYSKNFKLSAYYSSLDMEKDSNDNDEIRFEAKYSF